MGKNVGWYWKTNDRDIECFAAAYDVVIKHLDRTPKQLKLVMRVCAHYLIRSNNPSNF
jgi:hypothetical protein